MVKARLGHSKTKVNMADDLSLNPTRDDFAALLDQSMGGRDFMEGQVVHGKVVAIEKDFAIIDVGLKTEGRVPLKEFGAEEGKPALHVERLYANPGIQEGDAVDQAFMQLAKTKAEAMGCRLFADGGNEDETQALYSGDSRAPFEYVDANAGVMEREYEIEATLVE